MEKELTEMENKHHSRLLFDFRELPTNLQSFILQMVNTWIKLDKIKEEIHKSMLEDIISMLDQNFIQNYSSYNIIRCLKKNYFQITPSSALIYSRPQTELRIKR